QQYVLPRLMDLAMRNRLLSPYRTRVVSLASGRVLEIGIGSGLNLPFYAAHASEILGLEPHPKLTAMALRKASGMPVRIIEGSAESIPVESASIDSIVTTWTLCSI